MNHLVLAATILALMPALPAWAGSRKGSVPAAEPMEIALLTSHPVLRASLERIWRGSPSFRAALTDAARTGRRALVLTPDQVVVRDHAADSTHQPFDRRMLAEVSPVLDSQNLVTAVLVVINLPLIESAHEQRGSLPGEFQDDLDSVVAHEVFGHALPYLMAGSLAGQCADPAPGQRAADACAIQRENIVREELGMSRRTDAGLNSLLLAYRGRH